MAYIRGYGSSSYRTSYRSPASNYLSRYGNRYVSKSSHTSKTASSQKVSSYKKGGTISNIGKAAYSTFSSKVSSYYNSAKKTLTKSANNVTNKATTIYNNTKQSISNTANHAVNKATSLYNDAKKTLTNTATNVANKATTFYNDAKKTYSNVSANVKSKATQIYNDAKKGLSNAVDKTEKAISKGANFVASKVQGEITIPVSYSTKITLSSSVKTGSSNAAVTSSVSHNFSDKSSKIVGSSQDKNSGLSIDSSYNGKNKPVIGTSLNKKGVGIRVDSNGNTKVDLSTSNKYYTNQVSIGSSGQKSSIISSLPKSTSFEYSITTKPTAKSNTSSTIGIKVERDTDKEIKQDAVVVAAAAAIVLAPEVGASAVIGGLVRAAMSIGRFALSFA